jgi:hypothetical protein
MTRRNAPANPAATEHDLTVVNDRSLSGRYGALRVVQSHVGPIVVQWHHSRNRSGMIIADLHEGFEGAAVTDPGSRMPVHTIDLEFLASQVICIADDDAICCWVEIDNVTRPQRAARKSFALADGEEFDAAVFGNEVSIDIINLAAMKFVFAEV